MRRSIGEYPSSVEDRMADFNVALDLFSRAGEESWRVGIRQTLWYNKITGRQGFEPRFYGPEPYVLPLDDLPEHLVRRQYRVSLKLLPNCDWNISIPGCLSRAYRPKLETVDSAAPRSEDYAPQMLDLLRRCGPGDWLCGCASCASGPDGALTGEPDSRSQHRST